MTMRLLILFALLLTACGGGNGDSDDASDAGEAAVEQFETAVRGQWGRVWDDLHPEHQAVVSRDQYIDCQQGDTVPESTITVDETFQETLELARLGEVETTAVTLEFADDDNAEFITVHMVEVDSEWKWVLQGNALDAFEAGECP